MAAEVSLPYQKAIEMFDLAYEKAVQYGVAVPVRYHRLKEAMTDADYANDMMEHCQIWAARKSRDCVMTLHPSALAPKGDVDRARHEASVAVLLRLASEWAAQHAKGLRELQAASVAVKS